MKTLLQADLAVLVNTIRTSAGRQALLAYVIVMVCIAFGAALAGWKALLSESLVEALPRISDSGLSALFSVVLFVPLFLAMSLVGASIRSELFESRQVDLLLISPVSRLAIATRAFVRLLFMAFSLQFFASLPFMLGFVFKGGLSPWLLLAFPLSCLALTVPMVALLMLGQSLTVRFFTSPWVKMATQAVGVIGMLLITGLVLASIYTGNDQLRKLVEQVQQMDSAPWLETAPASLLVAATRGMEASPVLGCALYLISVVPLLFVVGLLLGRCRENTLMASRPILHRIRKAGTAWPVGVARSFVRKDIVQLLRNRGGVVAFLFFGCIQLVILKARHSGGTVSTLSPLPGVLQQVFGLVGAWQMLCLMLGSLHALSFGGDEGPNLPLLVTAPITPGQLLSGKVLVLAIPFVWTLSVVLVGAPILLGTSFGILMFFLLIALPILFIHVALIAAISSGLRFFHRKGDAPMAESLDCIGPVIAVSFSLGFLLFVTFKTKSLLTEAYRDTGPFAGWNELTLAVVLIGGLWLASALLLWAGFWKAKRNLCKVLGPQD